VLEKKSVGFPDLNANANNFQPTRPMGPRELPRQARVDHEMHIIRSHHERIAKAIEIFWGHRDCVEYLKQLILNGGDGFGRARVGFKQEVMTALMNLIELHEVTKT
jgi:hypothetical protein